MTTSIRLGAAVLATVLTACGDSGGTGGEGGGATNTCPAGRVCLDVVPAGDPAPGRLAVVWFRFEGTTGHDPTVAYDAPFDSAVEHVEIPLADVSQPPDIDLLCDRLCETPSQCPCQSEFRAGVAYVVVVTDFDGNGVIDATEVADSDNIVGIANVGLVWSATDAVPAPAPFDTVFPSGVVAGTHAYRITSAGAYEPADEGSTFELRAGTAAF
ncbi:MAG: hypothetical protein HOW73_25875 [Polyangiaceae bacterium]|nr:hypothetical protein [Polyangiaceae bacterium]